MSKTNKGIILAGGTGTRLYPLTLSISKQLLPIFDKPMIYYPLATMMQTNIRNILIITTKHDLGLYQKVLKDGSQWGINISYVVQEKPDGIAHAFLLGKSFIGNDNCCLILGDNVFYGHGLKEVMLKAASRTKGATIFGYWVKDPERYGVVEFDDEKKVVALEEKPKKPKSNYAVTGLYFYDNDVIEYAASLKPSTRGELEITDINNLYLKDNALNVELFDRGIAWLDTGTHESLLQASNFIETIESRQGLKVCCPEEIAYNNHWIDKDFLLKQAALMKNAGYSEYLKRLVELDSKS